jgi:hypothetical protein
MTKQEIKSMEQVIEMINANGKVAEFLGTKIEAVDSKVMALDIKVSAMDNKLDLIMAKLNKLNDNSYVRTPSTVRNNSYNTVNGTFRFVCKHEVTMTKKRYGALITRCRELGIKLACPDCAKKSAEAKYSDFVAKFKRLPNSDELKVIREKEKETRAQLTQQADELKAKRKELLAQKVEAERQAYIAEHYGTQPQA